MRYTENGVPILKDSKIEHIAYDFLREYDDYSLTVSITAPIAGIFDYLKENYGLTLVFANLGNRNNYKILGRTIFSKNMICIDNEIVHNNSPIFLFTSAHEIGHWLLHRHKQIKIDKSNTSIDNIDDCEKDFDGKKILKTPFDWIEHHANVFAASLLMPRDTFNQAVVSIQKEMGLTKNIGKVFLNDEAYSKRDLDELIIKLQNIFGTSKKSIRIRLENLDILINQSASQKLTNNNKPLHIIEILKSFIR